MEKQLEARLLERDKLLMSLTKSSYKGNGNRSDNIARFDYLMKEKHGCLLQANIPRAVSQYIGIYNENFTRYFRRYHNLK